MVLILFSSTLAGAENSVCSLLEVIVAIVYLTAFYPQACERSSCMMPVRRQSQNGQGSMFKVQG
jgi:hypothetical protein